MNALNVRQFAGNYAILAMGEVASKVCAFVAFAFLARTLGPSTFGSVEFALALIAVLTLVVEGGLSPYGAREVAKDPSCTPGLASRVMAIRYILAGAGYLLLYFLADFLSETRETRQLLLLYGTTLFVAPLLLPWVFQGLDRMGVVAVMNAIRWVLFAAGVFLWVREPTDGWRVPVMELGGMIAAACFGIFACVRGRDLILPQFEFKTSLALLWDALPIGLSQLLWAARVYFPIIFLGLWFGQDSAGWYGASQRLVLAINTFGVLYLFNLLPSLSRAAGVSQRPFNDIIAASIPVAAWSTVFVGALGSCFASEIVDAVYGSDYGQSAGILQVLIWLVPTALFTGHFRYILVADGAQHLDLACGTAGLGACLLLTPTFTQAFGGPGAATAVLVSELVTLLFAGAFVRQRVVLNTVIRFWAGPLFAGVVMMAIFKTFPFTDYWMRGITGALFYVAVLVIAHPGIFTEVRSVLLKRTGGDLF